VAALSRSPPERSSRTENSSFNRFTERARKVLTLAQEEAKRFNHNYIGTEHLLLGLVREGEGVAAKVLSNLGVGLPQVRKTVEFIIGRGERRVRGEIGLTPRGKKVIELGVDEARRLGHSYIGTEHLLLGLIREGEGIAAGVLESLGVNLEKVRSEVIRVLTGPSYKPDDSTPIARDRPSRPEPRPRGTTWEYCILHVRGTGLEARVVRIEGAETAGAEEPSSLLYTLNSMGSSGWQLVGIDASAEISLYILERAR